MANLAAISAATGLLIVLALPAAAQQSIAAAQQYNLINGYLCIKATFIETILNRSTEILCSYYCSTRSNCQAFSVADGPCQLFVFDKCTKYVKDCSCNRRGPVFVKSRPGLPLGALCPSTFGDDLCGVKYKLTNQLADWSQQSNLCHSEAGSMVIFADVIDRTEMNQVNYLYNKSMTMFWLGGFQAPGSVEPYGGWSWVDCNITIDNSLWGAGEPSKLPENAVFIHFSHPDLADSFDSTSSIVGACECLSPFN